MNRKQRVRTCTYAVAIDGYTTPSEIVSIGAYLSTLSRVDCEVLILDDSAPEQFESNRCVLRWVGRHLAVDRRHRTLDGAVDLLRAGVELATTEKVIIAGSETRFSPDGIIAISSLLDRHEVVEPDEYVAVSDWITGIEAGRILVHRGVEQASQVRSTFAVRRSAYRPLLDFEERSGDTHLRRLMAAGMDAYDAHDVFVRRDPPRFERWVKSRIREASADFSLPLKTVAFFGLLPMLILIAAIGGLVTAGGYAGIVAFTSVLIAAKGRAGAANVFPMRACFFAPLWVAERSVMVYCALFVRLRKPARVAAVAAVGPDTSRIAGTR